MFCKSLPVQTSPEAPVQKNAAAGGSTQGLQGPGTASRQLLHVAGEMGQAQRNALSIPREHIQCLFWPAKKDQEEKKGKGVEEGTDRHQTHGSAHLEIMNWASSPS